MRVGVLGGGLTGACVAMELAAAGINVDVYDRNDRLVTQASAQNEGKIHLGYVYAKDRSLKTARQMIEGAISFSPLLRRWVGSDIDRVPVSQPFYYAVHRESLLSSDEVAGHLRACTALARELSGEGRVEYFGADFREMPEPVPDHGGLFDPARVAAAFRTPEIAIDSAALAELVRRRVASEPGIRCLFNANVLDVEIGERCVGVGFEIAGQTHRQAYDHVVNALWDGRLAVDDTAGLRPARPWIFRVKHYLRLRRATAAETIPSTTIVLGPFGDVVAYANGAVYLSWYPAGMRRISAGILPAGWPAALDRDSRNEIRDSIVSGLTAVVPALSRLDGDLAVGEIQGGVIFAWGETDIQDPVSALHERWDVGVASCGRYHSIDTGKLTTAPLFAKRAADRIRAS